MSTRLFFTRDPLTQKKRAAIWLPNAQGSLHATTDGKTPLCRATTKLLDEVGDNDARSRDTMACSHCQNLVLCQVQR